MLIQKYKKENTLYDSTHIQRGNQYASAEADSELEDASPHRLIQILLEGLLARINSAKDAIAQNNLPAKSDSINKAIAIVAGLHESLDLDNGGEIAQNLGDLYAYISSRLLQASFANSIEMLDEVANLIRDVKSGWDAIEP